MLRIEKVEFSGPPRHGVPQVVQRSPHLPESVGAPLATRAGPPLARPFLRHDLRLGKIFNTSDALGQIANIRSRRRHADLLHKECVPVDFIGISVALLH